MKQFLKYLLASILGFFVSIFILLFTFFIISAVLISSFSRTETVSISENSILELKLDYELPERSNYQPVSNITGFPSMRKTVGLNDITRIIKSAKTDDRIKGIFLDLDNLKVGSIAKVNTIRETLKDFKASSKFIIAHGNSINERAYYMASVADSIFLTSTGSLEFDGFGLELAFFKDALEKLEIEPQIFQYGKFKGATEPFKLNKLSDENREQLSDYLNSVYSDFLSEISENVAIAIDTLREIADKGSINSAEDAEKFGLIDGLFYRDQVDSVIESYINSEGPPKKIKVNDYLLSMSSDFTSTDNRIAVIYAIGEIVNTSGDEYTIGTKNIIESIKRAKNNDRVKAIVMRVNSPGGSPLTSDMIWREIKIASKSKPFIVSMGDVAASGGYYISCIADLIVAERSTLSGSIGVYGIIPNTQKFFNNKLGITFDRIETSEYSNLYTITTPLTKHQENLIKEQIDEIYYDFVYRVAEGRNMTFDEVDKISQGRIWSGIDAKRIGLVDTLGNLEVALAIAAEKAEISEFRIIEYPSPKEAFEKIIELLYSDIKGSFNKYIFSEALKHINGLSEALKYTGIQTRLPFNYTIY